MNLSQLKARYERKVGARDELQKQYETIAAKIKALNREVKVSEKAIETWQGISLISQNSLTYHIGNCVTNAMACVFDDYYKLTVDYEDRKNGTECNLLFERNENYIQPLRAGGGCLDVAAFGLRIASWSLRKQYRPIFILDEPFKHIKGRGTNLRSIRLLKEVSQDLGIQFIIVSDERAPREDIEQGADKLFIVEKKKGKGSVIIYD